MKLRALPIFFSLVATLILLFGGWYSYQQYYIQKPIQSFITHMPNVVLNHLQINNNEVIADVDFKNPATFGRDYQQIIQFIQGKTGDKKVVIHLPKQGEKLKNLWESKYFDLAEAIDTKQFSHIPKLMNEMEKNRQLDKAETRMDDQNIYFYLQSGKDHLYAVLPLENEVKANE